ncbi:hypothetical protein U1Q18_015417 [Sarracenia purpurea var. burkii]
MPLRRVQSIFVDNNSELMHQDWLRRLFNQCGSIVTVFIPAKRRKLNNSGFGFVKFRDVVSIEEVIKMYNGV